MLPKSHINIYRRDSTVDNSHYLLELAVVSLAWHIHTKDAVINQSSDPRLCKRLVLMYMRAMTRTVVRPVSAHSIDRIIGPLLSLAFPSFNAAIVACSTRHPRRDTQLNEEVVV